MGRRGDGGLDAGPASADGLDFQISIIFNPFGAGDDVINAGVNGFNPGNYDVGGALFDNNIINTDVSGADYLYDIVTPFATEMNTAAAVGAEWWAGLMAML